MRSSWLSVIGRALPPNHRPTPKRHQMHPVGASWCRMRAQIHVRTACPRTKVDLESDAQRSMSGRASPQPPQCGQTDRCARQTALGLPAPLRARPLPEPPSRANSPIHQSADQGAFPYSSPLQSLVGRSMIAGGGAGEGATAVGPGMSEVIRPASENNMIIRSRAAILTPPGYRFWKSRCR